MGEKIVEKKQQVTTNIFAHRAEVVIALSGPTTNFFLPPAAAREIARHLIHAAEIAEQQMDAEEGR